MSLPTTGLPTARQVADWAISIIGQRVNVDNRLGAQCWDLPNYIFKRYWGFFTSGNAVDMAWYNYPKGFKFIRNTPDLIPKPGWFAVWNIGKYGHTDVVIDGATKDYFWGIDQNWVIVDELNGSPAAKVKHNYNGVVGFVVPPYKEEPAPNTTPDTPAPSTTNTATIPKPQAPQIIEREVTKIKYVTKDEDTTPANFIEDVMLEDKNQAPKRIILQNDLDMLSVYDLYKYKHSLNKDLLPHYLVDRYNIWHCRDDACKTATQNDAIVIVICEDMNAPDGAFIRNELEAIELAKNLATKYAIPFDAKHVSVEKHAWRTFRLHMSLDVTDIDNEDVEGENTKLIAKLIDMLTHKKEIIADKHKDVVEKTRIKVQARNMGGSEVSKAPQPPKSTTAPSTTSSAPETPQIVNETSNYSFAQALNKQMTVSPMDSNGYGWFGASRSAVENAMNPNRIWNDATQKYQMLDLGKAQNIPVDKLNQILQGQGTLSGQGQAFSDACKKYNLNEIYLIAHAFVESGHGTSNFASGSYGAYNFFGIAAYDSNPNYAMTFAKEHGWTTPAKAIVGGAEFVRNGYINAGQNTLYRMRWNPKNPATHQYATAIQWCSTQAKMIKQYYDKIGLKGMHFIKDNYR